MRNVTNEIDIAFEDLILIDLTPTEIALLGCIEQGIDTIDDLSTALGLSITTVNDLISDLKNLGLAPIFYDTPRENTIDQALFASFLPEYSQITISAIAKHAGTTSDRIATYMYALFHHNPKLLEDYRQNLLPELINAGYTNTHET